MKALLPLALLVAALAACPKSEDTRQAAAASPERPQPNYTEVLKPLPRTLVEAPPAEGGPVAKTGEEMRLSVKIAALKTLADEIELARAEVPDHEKELEALLGRFKAVKEKLPEDEVKTTVAEVAQAIALEPMTGQGPAELRLRLGELEKRSAPLLAREELVEGDTAQVAALKAELRRQQNAIVPAAGASRFAAGALTKLEELRRAVPLLEEKAARKK